jgi:PEP-CTERM putative exosortase interaction domain
MSGSHTLTFPGGKPYKAGFGPGKTLEPVPEPATIALLGIGIAGLAGVEVRRRRKKKVVDNS